jgi:hypothetical protein
MTATRNTENHSSTPTGFHIPAQGCDAPLSCVATLGNRPPTVLFQRRGSKQVSFLSAPLTGIPRKTPPNFDICVPTTEDWVMTEKEMVRQIREMEVLFPGVLGNPVTFAARWGLPLSKSYLGHLKQRRNGINGGRARVNRRRPKTFKP